MGQRIDKDARFRRLEKKAKQQATAQKQQEQEGLKRRFASLGLSSSGEAIKQEQLSEQRSGEALGRRLDTISSLKEQEAIAEQERQEARQFQTSEREAGQKFGAGQAALARRFQSGERMASQSFGAEQTRLNRVFSKEQLQKQQDFQKNVVLKLQGEQFDKQMKLAIDKFGLDKDISEFNKKQAMDEANKPEFFEKIIGTGKDLFQQVFGDEDGQRIFDTFFNPDPRKSEAPFVGQAGREIGKIFGQ